MTKHDVLASAREDPANQVDQLVGSVAEAKLVRTNPMMCGEGLTEVVSARIRVSVQHERLTGHRGHRLRRGTIGVFIRRQLHDVVDAELAPKLAFGLARLIRRQRQDVGCREVAHLYGSARSGIASEDLGITRDAAQLLDCGQDGAVRDVAVHLEEEEVPPFRALGGA